MVGSFAAAFPLWQLDGEAPEPGGDDRAQKSPAKTAGVVLTQSSTATNGNAAATGARSQDTGTRQNAPVHLAVRQHERGLICSR